MINHFSYDKQEIPVYKSARRFGRNGVDGLPVAWTFRCGGEIHTVTCAAVAQRWMNQGFFLTPVYA